MTQPKSLAVEHEPIPRVERIEFVTVSLPFLHPFGTSVHVWTCKEALLLRLEAGGVVAWGECVADPDPFYLSETTTTARHIIEGFLLPLLEPGLPFGELLARFRRRPRPHHGQGHGRERAHRPARARARACRSTSCSASRPGGSCPASASA